MIRLIRKFRDEDNAVAMVWLATTLVLLLGTAGFAVDLGWLYLNASRTQRAVDAAALAGVTNLPGFPNKADLEARDAARANGYDVCDPSATGCGDTLVATPLSDNELEVELATNVRSFFLGVLGFDNFDITRRAKAEYVKPVPLGSPDRCFGQDPTGTYCPADSNDFWAAVEGPYTRRQYGDPYSTNCLEPTSSGTSCSTWNPEYARGGEYGGFYFAVDVDSGASNLAINFYDIGFEDECASCDTGDEKWGPAGGSGKPNLTTRIRFHEPDSTPNDPTDNPLATCSTGFNDFTLNPGPPASIDQWATMCTISGSITPGIWVMHVETITAGSGTNNYSLAATVGSGPQPRVYGINDMGIFSNADGSAPLYLVEVAEIHAGSKLELKFFDAGDSGPNSSMAVEMPDGSGGFTEPPCDYYVTNVNGVIDEQGSLSDCEWTTTNSSGSSPYNNDWITAIIDIPSDYTCNSGNDGCFWFMDLDMNNAYDNTVWRARVIGNPVRLVP